MIAYLNGRYVYKEDAKISADDRGFLFSDGLYEVIRSYEGRLFQTDAHLERLAGGTHILHIIFSEIHKIKEIAEYLITENQLTRGDAIVYIQVTRGAAPRTHRFPPPETKPTLYIAASKFFPKKEELAAGINAILVPDQRWARCDIKTISLLANVLAHQKAVESDAAEAIFVRDAVALEGTHSNLFGVFDGTVITAPKSNYILPGITRAVALDLCQKLDIPFREEPIFEDHLFEADELMIIGTTVEITPVVRINGTPIDNNTPGPITRRLQQAFRELTHPAN